MISLKFIGLLTILKAGDRLLLKGKVQNAQDHEFLGSSQIAVGKLIEKTPIQMHYNITKEGRSTLRNLTQKESSFAKVNSSPSCDGPKDCKILKPVLMLFYGDEYVLDKAHEIILGVNETNIEEAEYAATHRGKTSWSKDHPLNSDQDMLHSIIHRLEGKNEGEGGYIGYENAKYWLFGGGKMLEMMEDHVVRSQLRDYVAGESHLKGLGLITEERRQYEIIAGGGKMRNVYVNKGAFDFLRYCDLCQKRETLENKEQ